MHKNGSEIPEEPISLHPIEVHLLDQLETADTRQTTRREFLRRGLIAGAGTVVLGSYAGIWEPRRVVVRRVELRLPRLPEAFDGTTIAQISDIHFEEFLPASHIRDVVDEVNRLDPDIVAITGDYATKNWGEANVGLRASAKKGAECAPILAGLKSRFGRFAVLGNHDASTQPDIVADALVQNRITVLRNASVPVERNGARIWIAGADDVLQDYADFPKTFHGIPREEMTIALVHEPDAADKVQKYGADLQLSGHSHGGQIRIPLIGAPVLPRLARKYPLGFYQIGKMQLFTNPGVGVVTVPFRFDCPPEITFFALRRP